MKRRDRQLGMDCDITRRDFLNGVNIAVTGSLLSAPLSQAHAALDSSSSAQMMPGYYPPTRDGLRGSHPGSFEVAHLMPDGARYDDPADSIDTGEEYDLIVVGGGISGLAAAHFFRKEAVPDARILIVENHDDFGGHAKRNEFEYNGRTMVDLGGTEYVEAPWSYPGPAKAVLDDIGVDVGLAQKVFDHDLYKSLNLRGGIFFDHKTFGANRLVAGDPGIPQSEQQTAYVTLPAELENAVGEENAVSAYLEKTPLSAIARDEILALFCGEQDYLPRKSKKKKLALLLSISYLDFLRNIVGSSAEVINFFWMRLNSTAVHVRHVGNPHADKQVEITYVQDGNASRVCARYCAMACYHSVIPHLCPELPGGQKEALRKTIRMPLVSTNVLVDNWTALEKPGIFSAYCPGSFFSDIRLTYPLQFADYKSARSPDEPMTIHMYRIPLPGEENAAEQFRAGRYDLLGTSFAAFEQGYRATQELLNES